MTKERAYCCLNCTASSNCCGICGECPTCCEDCGDTSSCATSAYFKDGTFYKNFQETVSITYGDWYVCGDCSFDWDPRGNTYSRSDYVIDTEFGLISCNGSYTTNYRTGDGELPTSLTETTTLTSCYTSLQSETQPLQIASGPCPAISPEGDVGCDCCSGNARPAVNGCSNPLRPLNLKETNSGGCLSEEEGEGCLAGTGESYNFISVEISFRNEVNLYNSQGQDVGNIIGATYNLCNATASWNAPACHFFAP